VKSRWKLYSFTLEAKTALEATLATHLQSSRLAALAIAIAASAAPAAADSVQIPPSRDATLYEDGVGALASGSGSHFFVGQAAGRRRGLLYFDIAGNVPAASTIQSVELVLHLSRLPLANPPAITCTLHRVLSDWGEGASNAGEPGGSGAAAQPGDATWLHTFRPSATWATPGGDFAPSQSGSFSAGGIGAYTVGSTLQMVADVQGWLDAPSSNFGWLLRGAEGSGSNARRFDTRENPEPGFRPVLRVEYEPGIGVEPETWSRVKGLFR
jgi:hypothetical protein